MATLAKANRGTGKDLTKNLSLATVSLEFSLELLMDSLSATPVTSPRSSLLQSSIIFKLPYHLVQRCLHHSANCPGTRPSHWDRPLNLCPGDICAAFPSQSPVHLSPFDICAAFPSHSPFHHRPVDICAAFSSHSPFHLRPVDICAASSSSPPPFHQVNIRHGHHHALILLLS